MMNIFLLLNIQQEWVLQIILGCIFGSQENGSYVRKLNKEFQKLLELPTQAPDYTN